MLATEGRCPIGETDHPLDVAAVLLREMREAWEAHYGLTLPSEGIQILAFSVTCEFVVELLVEERYCTQRGGADARAHGT